MLNGEALEEVDQFKYLGSVIAANDEVEVDVRHRVNEGCKVLGALKGLMKNRGLGIVGEPTVQNLKYPEVKETLGSCRSFIKMKQENTEACA